MTKLPCVLDVTSTCGINFQLSFIHSCILLHIHQILSLKSTTQIQFHSSWQSDKTFFLSLYSLATNRMRQCPCSSDWYQRVSLCSLDGSALSLREASSFNSTGDCFTQAQLPVTAGASYSSPLRHVVQIQSHLIQRLSYNAERSKSLRVPLTVFSSSLSLWAYSPCSSWARLLSLSASLSAWVSRSTWAPSSLTSLSRSPTWLSHWDWQPSSFSRSSCLPCSSSCQIQLMNTKR